MQLIFVYTNKEISDINDINRIKICSTNGRSKVQPTASVYRLRLSRFLQFIRLT